MLGCVEMTFTILIGVLSLTMVSSLPAEVVPEKESYRARVRVYVDKSGVDEFTFDNPGKDLTEHVKGIFVNVNEIYESLLPALNVTLELEQVITIDNIYPLQNGRQYIYVEQTGYQFWKWALKTYDAKAYDLAILFTGFEMYNVGGVGSFGHGYQGSVCTRNAVGAVEIQEPAGTIGLAHEIGHILGAAHDSEAPKTLCKPGSYRRGNLMNTITILDSPLRFIFSQCSILQISEHFADLTKLDRNCLLVKRDMNASVPLLQDTADEVCEERLGEGWEMHRSHYYEYGDEFCKDLRCAKMEDDERVLKNFDAPDGLKCGKNKRCFKQKCVLVTHGDVTMSDACPWGSQSDSYVHSAYRSSCAKMSCSDHGRLCCGRCKR